MLKYVAGFLFNETCNQLVLIEKNHPDWQMGQCNGVGGKIRDGESPHEAMVREFEEETGLYIEEWQELCMLRQIGVYEVVFYKAIDESALSARTQEDEQVILVDPGRLPSNVIPNLKWLVPMCLDKTIRPFVVEDVGGN